MTTVIGLVWARLRARRSAVALIATAVGGCILVLGSLQGVGVVTADQATRRALAELPASDRLVGIVRAAEDAADTDAADMLARAALAGLLPMTEPVVAATVFRPPRDAVRVVALDDASRWVSLISGVLPQFCSPTGPCEVLRLGSAIQLNGTGEIGTTAVVGDRSFRIVGAAQPRPDMPLDLAGTPGLILLAEGVNVLRRDPAMALVPRSDSWLAPLDPNRTHAWSLGELTARVDAIRRDLPGAGRTFKVDAPDRTIALVQARSDVAVGRLVFISSLVVGVLLAFAVFAAAVERPEVGLEYNRLQRSGARRSDLAWFIALEAGIPALLGSLIGVAAAALAIGLIAASQGEPASDVIRLALLDPGSLVVTLSIAALAAAAVGLGIHPGSGRLLQPRLVAAAAIPVVIVLVWDRALRGPIQGADLASQAASPATVLLPGLLGLAVILGSLVILPPLLRGLARMTRRAPVWLRLATTSIARDPLRPAATLTLLAFSLGSAVLGVVYADTLTRGAADSAAFTTGLDIRVLSYSPSGRFAGEVIPRLAAGDLGADVEVQPITRLEGQSATGRTLLLTGLDPTVIPEFRRWRSDYASLDPAHLTAAITVPGPWVLPGHALPAGIRELAIDVVASGDPIAITAILDRGDGTYRYVDLGDLGTGSQTLRKPLFTPGELAAMGPSDPTGWWLVGILAGNGGPSGADGADPGARQQGDLTILGLPEIAAPAQMVHLDVSGLKTRQMIRAAVRTDGLVLPALVSPDLAADVGADGELGVTLVSGLVLRVRPVAVIDRFPTVIEPNVGLVVIDQGPLLLAMTARDPGSGTPNQVLLRLPNDERTAQAVATLSSDSYPSLVINSRPAIEDARARDPFAIGIVWALIIGALAGLVLSAAGVLLGVAAELGDNRGELREIEELGAPPSALRTLVVARAALLAVIGAVSGTVIGIGLGWLAALTISVSAESGPAVPPLALVAPWPAILGMVAGVLVVIVIGVAALARGRLATGPAPSTVRSTASGDRP